MAAVLFSTSAQLSASGLRTKLGEFEVRGLKIGQQYSLSQLVNLPLRVVNIGGESERVLIDVVPMDKSAVEGFEPIPASSTPWITLEKHVFTVEPNHEAVTDIIVTIPNDPKLLGRRFEGVIWSRTDPTTTKMYGAGLKSILLLDISSVPPSEDELKKKFVDRHLANLDFTLYPSEGRIDNVPVGSEVDLKKDFKVSVKLVNPNDSTLHFKLRSIPYWESLLTLPDGYEAASHFDWVRPSTDTVTVDGNSIKDTALIINIPDRDEYRGKGYGFVIAVEILEQEISARVYYKLLLKTQPKPGTEVPEHREEK